MTSTHISSDRSALDYRPTSGGMLDFGHRLVAMAAGELDLAGSVTQQLMEPERLIEVSIPDPRADGGVLRCFRSQHSSALGPSKGGVRMSPSVTRAEVEALSLFMTLKTATVDLPLGGGKGGIVVDPRSLDDEQRVSVAAAFARRLADVIGPEIDVLGPDVGTGPEEMDAMHRAWREVTGAEGSPATGKSLDAGGLDFRTGATAHGLDIVFGAFADRLSLGDGLGVAIHGFGSVGRNLAQRLVDQGHVLVAVSDSGGAAVNADGLDLDELVDRKAERGSVAEGDEPSAAVLSAECDVLVPAALQGAIDETVAAEVKAGLVLEGANGPCTWAGNAVLGERGVTVVPDILANAGGVAASFEEMTDPDHRDDRDAIDHRFTKRLETASADVWSAATERGLDLRTAAATIAVERVLAASPDHPS